MIVFFGQYPVYYILTLVWYKKVLPLAPECVQYSFGYTVVGVVDDLKDDQFYLTVTNDLYFSFLNLLHIYNK